MVEILLGWLWLRKKDVSELKVCVKERWDYEVVNR